MPARSSPPHVCLTEGVFLFRIVRVVASGADHDVDPEDCYLFDVVRVG